MLAWLHKFQMHRFDSVHILAHDRVDGASAFENISSNPANQSFVCICVKKYLDIHHIPQRLVNEDQNSINDDDLPRFKPACLLQPQMCRKIVDRLIDPLALFQIFKMSDQEISLKGIRMIEIDLVWRQTVMGREVTIVRIMLNDENSLFVQQLEDLVRDGRFARSCSAGDTNNEWLHHGSYGRYWGKYFLVQRIYAINQELSTFWAIDKEGLIHDHLAQWFSMISSTYSLGSWLGTTH